MVRHQIPPSLADLSQEFAGSIPVTLIRSWVESDKSDSTHTKMLEPYLVKGTVVSSDSSGLSRLSQTTTVLDVAKLVSQPKEIIYAYGKQIGGRPIGVWFADNTTMFYDESIPTDQILEQMAQAQKDIRSLTVQVGIGIHSANFIEIGGGLFGTQAHVVEEITENYTQATEIVLSHAFREKLPLPLRVYLSERADLKFVEPFYTVNYNDSKLKSKTNKYTDSLFPIPFDENFYKRLRTLKPTDEREVEKLYQQYAQQKTVVVVKIQHPVERHLLNQLTNWILASAIVNQSSLDFAIERIKSNGSLAILVSNNPKNAISFAKDIRNYLHEAGYHSRIALATGEVLIFSLPDKGKDITGNPVNIASKLAEDAGETDKIYIHESVDYSVRAKTKQPFSFIVSRIELKGIEI